MEMNKEEAKKNSLARIIEIDLAGGYDELKS